MKNLAKAVIAVMKEVQGMEKNSKVGTGKTSYDGTKDQDVKEVFNKALAENGLCIIPIDYEEETKISRWEEVDPWSKSTPKDKKVKQSVFTKVNAKYLLLHESGESQVVAGYGHGVDPQDKSAGKATTYALKNALLYTFLTPVGKIDDTDLTHSNDIATPQPPQQQPPQQQQPPKQQPPKALPEMQKDSDNWKAMVGFIESGKLTSITQVEAKYKLTPVLKAEIIKLIKDKQKNIETKK